MKTHGLYALLAALLLPQLAFAAPQTFRDLVGLFLDLISLAVPLIFALVLLVFLWSITQAWILGGGDATSVEKGKKIALAGIIGLVVMASVWGIVAFLANSVFGG